MAVKIFVEEKKFWADVKKIGFVSAFLRLTRGEYGAKKGKDGGTDINKLGRTLRK